MLQIVIQRNKENKITGYKAEGHCNYAEHGKDIVCASTSTLLQLPFLGLKSYNGKMSEIVKGYINEGILAVEIPSEYPQVILDVILIALKEIEKQYPGYVGISEVVK